MCIKEFKGNMHTCSIVLPSKKRNTVKGIHSKLAKEATVAANFPLKKKSKLKKVE